MLKKILKLNGAQELSKNEKKSINGGITDSCNRAILDGFCVRKGKAVCPSSFPIASSGGCCCQD